MAEQPRKKFRADRDDRRPQQCRQVIADLVAVKDRCGRFGMLRTMHALDEALQVAGFELADLMEGKQTYA